MHARSAIETICKWKWLCPMSQSLLNVWTCVHTLVTFIGACDINVAKCTCSVGDCAEVIGYCRQ